MDNFDYVIVGAGSAGCVLASRLSEDPGTTVALLEAGPRDWHPYIHIPAGFIKTFYDKRFNWCYEMEPCEWSGGRRIFAPRGKTLGGSSAINGHVYNRGQRMDFDNWAQRGNRGWGYADVLPYFRRMERRIAPDNDADETFRGKDGPLTVSNMEWSHPLCSAFVEGAVQHGIPFNPDYNATDQEGVNYTQRTIERGRRVTAATAFLHPAMKRPNLTVLTHAHATGLVLEGKRAVGVRYAKGGPGGQPREVRARREVILSGGVYNSPQLLQLSGIGPEDVLQRLGIPVAHELAGVGRNLRDHFGPRFVARVKNVDTINEMSRGWRLGVEAANWLFRRKGILALNPTLVYCFWRSNPAIENTALQLTFTPASYMEGVQGQLESEPGMTIAVWQQRPESTGYVEARSADPFEAPLIQSNYLAEAEDRRVLLAGMKLARALLASKPLQPYYDHEAFPGPQIRTDDELLDTAKQRGTTIFHPAGTCRMGPASDPTAVVDDQLRVHGMEGLRVVDASIMPMMISANLNASALMIGEKGADMIRGRAAPEPVVLG
jgi:choline dehydrogenase